MGDFREIATDGLLAVARDPAGAVPIMQWLKIAELVVDDRYQRPIDNRGRINIRKIAEDFDWSCFAPVIVAGIAGGRYTIVDGQHRTTAAKLIGIESVPCIIVIADRQAQARAFRAVNGRTTKIHPLSLFKASVTAGEASAIAVEAAATAAGLRILPYPRSRSDQSPRELQCPQELMRILEKRGDAELRFVLALAAALAGDKAGLLGKATFVALDRLTALWFDQDELLSLAPSVNFDRCLGRAEDEVRSKGGFVADALFQRLQAAFDKARGGGGDMVASLFALQLDMRAQTILAVAEVEIAGRHGQGRDGIDRRDDRADQRFDRCTDRPVRMPRNEYPREIAGRFEHQRRAGDQGIGQKARPRAGDRSGKAVLKLGSPLRGESFPAFSPDFRPSVKAGCRQRVQGKQIADTHQIALGRAVPADRRVLREPLRLAGLDIAETSHGLGDVGANFRGRLSGHGVSVQRVPA